MTGTIEKKKVVVILISLLLVVFGSAVNYGLIPHTSGGIGVSPNLIEPKNLVDPYKIIDDTTLDSINVNPSAQVNAFQDFVSKINDGNQYTIRGVYAEDVMALPVVQQPAGQAGFVSTIDGVVTQFAMPSQYGVVGLLAHNYLSGELFYDLEIGDIVQIVYGDGSVEKFMISDIQSYQALQPNSANSQFVDLETSQKISATELFKRVYFGNRHLTLQTCIEQGEIDSWGRMFIIAYPI